MEGGTCMIKKKPKWETKEVEILVETVSSYQNLDRKFSNSYSSSDRSKFWKETTEKINAIGGYNRSSVQVEKKWRDLKSLTKSKEAKRRGEMRKTGGGLMDIQMLTTMEQKILCKIPTCSIEGITGGKDTSSTLGDDRVKESSMSPHSQQEETCSIQRSTDTERVLIAERVLIEDEEEASTSSKAAEDIATGPINESVGSKKRPRDNISEYIMKMEERKLQEMKNITETLKSIDNSLKEIVKFKKQKIENVNDCTLDILGYEL